MSLSHVDIMHPHPYHVLLSDMHPLLVFPLPHRGCTLLHLKLKQQQLPSSLQFSAHIFKTHMPRKSLGSHGHKTKTGISLPHSITQ